MSAARRFRAKRLQARFDPAPSAAALAAAALELRVGLHHRRTHVGLHEHDAPVDDRVFEPEALAQLNATPSRSAAAASMRRTGFAVTLSSIARQRAVACADRDEHHLRKRRFELRDELQHVARRAFDRHDVAHRRRGRTARPRARRCCRSSANGGPSAMIATMPGRICGKRSDEFGDVFVVVAQRREIGAASTVSRLR